ncbi:MAG: RCC1 domain-containing protein [Polyangiaceae bacterium]
MSTVVFGRSHGCILGRDGTVRCWGSRDDGRLGTSSVTTVAGAMPLAGLSQVVELVAQGRDYCARRADGRVSCWGSLGGRSTEVAETRGPTSSLASAWPFCVQLASTRALTCRLGGYRDGVWLAPAFPGNSRAKSLWAYDGLDLHALTQGGELLSWEPPMADPSPATSPVRFRRDGWSKVTAVSPDGSCAIDTAGNVSCRCDPSDRALPICTDAKRVFPVEGLGGARDYLVHTRGGDVCALRADGSVACGHHPSVAVQDAVDGTAVAAIRHVTELRQSTELATGGVGDFKAGGYACALAESGEVLCWGQVPLASGTQRTPAPVRVPGLPKASHVALGATNGCIIGEDQNVYCWGQDDVGQSSGHPPEAAAEPLPVAMPRAE